MTNEKVEARPLRTIGGERNGGTGQRVDPHALVGVKPNTTGVGRVAKGGGASGVRPDFRAAGLDAFDRG